MLVHIRLFKKISSNAYALELWDDIAIGIVFNVEEILYRDHCDDALHDETVIQ